MAEDESINDRTEGYRKNPRLEGALEQLNRLLAIAEAEATREFSEPALPQVFLLGNARSGTTLALQWLAASGAFGYPTNLLSRFFCAPYVGALVQKVLTDPAFSFRDELGEFARAFDFTSTMGKTRGALAPHEFWYFWRRFFPGQELKQIDEEKISPQAIEELRREMAALEHHAGRPLAMKAMHMNFNVPFFARIFPRALFVHIHRQPLYNLQSLLEARIRQFGTTQQWYSVKPPEHESLEKLSPMKQVAGQVYFTNQHVSNALAELPAERSHTIRYEDLCDAPGDIFTTIAERVAALGGSQSMEYRGPTTFPNGNLLRLLPEELAEASEAWKGFAGSPFVL